mgnify:CR=1 FL=1
MTKQYSILSNTQGGVVEFAVAAGAIYLAMSLPLAWFSTWFERRLDRQETDPNAQQDHHAPATAPST